MSFRTTAECLCAVVLIATLAYAQDRHVPSDTEPVEPKGFPSIKMRTLGGKQFWTDHVWHGGWKIQQNALTGHWRLIDDEKVRRAWGTRAACQKMLDHQALEVDAASKRFVLLLHGLMRSSDSMTSLGDSLAEALDCTVVKFEYASTRASIADHAAAFREVLAKLPQGVELSLVGHSMGNIVIRHAIHDLQTAKDQPTLSRIKHVVMIGPPNQGASIARQLAKVGGIYEWVTGEGGMELGPRWKDFEAHLATPHCPFGIIAGKLDEEKFQNPLVNGESDFVVAVDETRLAGEADFLHVSCLHSFLMDDPTVQAAVAHFIEHNKFQDEPSVKPTPNE